MQNRRDILERGNDRLPVCPHQLGSMNAETRISCWSDAPTSVAAKTGFGMSLRHCW
jgi:hypothetical protein